MHWVIQSNIYNEEGYQTFLDTLDRMGLQKTLVKVVPFIGELEATEGELPPDGADVIVMGSYTLARVAKQRNWRPGALLQNLDYKLQGKHWGDRMLNHDATVHFFGEVPEQPVPFFMRPVGDSKAFTGFVCDWPYYQEWIAGMRRMGPETADPVNDPAAVNLLTLETPVMVSRKKEIWSETRTWIIDGRVRTASGYKVGTIKRYTPPEMVDRRITDFAQECADIFCPNEAFVLDVGDTPDGLKVVEINNLNSAGFYHGNMGLVIQALEDLANDGSELW